MQTNAKQAVKGRSATRPVYPQMLKNQSLKLLFDYSRTTGKKWQAIRDEIMRLVGSEASDTAPLLTRQNLESWVKRGTNLGDDKFRFVYEFLTHPETLGRPEFARARNLTTMGRIESAGRHFEDFFYETIKLETMEPSSREESQADIGRPMAIYEGEYLASNDEETFMLSFRRFQPWRFFVSHLASWPNIKRGRHDDLDMTRHSGFAVQGKRFRMWTKGVLYQDVREFHILPIAGNEGFTGELLLLQNSVFDEFTARALIYKTVDRDARLRYVDPLTDCLEFEKTDDPSLQSLVEKYQWNIPL